MGGWRLVTLSLGQEDAEQGGLPLVPWKGGKVGDEFKSSFCSALLCGLE